MAVVPINWFVKIGFTEGDTERGFRKTVEMSCARLMSLRSTLHFIYFSGLCNWTLRNFWRLPNQKFVVCFHLNFFTFNDKIGVAEDKKVSKSFLASRVGQMACNCKVIAIANTEKITVQMVMHFLKSHHWARNTEGCSNTYTYTSNFWQ